MPSDGVDDEPHGLEADPKGVDAAVEGPIARMAVGPPGVEQLVAEQDPAGVGAEEVEQGGLHGGDHHPSAPMVEEPVGADPDLARLEPDPAVGPGGEPLDPSLEVDLVEREPSPVLERFELGSELARFEEPEPASALLAEGPPPARISGPAEDLHGGGRGEAADAAPPRPDGGGHRSQTFSVSTVALTPTGVGLDDSPMPWPV